MSFALQTVLCRPGSRTSVKLDLVRSGKTVQRFIVRACKRDILLNEVRTETVPVVGVAGILLLAVVQYAYLGRCALAEHGVLPMVLELTKAASRLGMEKLEELCLSRLRKNMDAAIAVRLLEPDEYGNPFVRNARSLAEAYALRHLVSGHFNDLRNSSFLSFLRDDRLYAPFEEQVLDCVLQWVQHDVSHRQSLGSALLAAVRLGCIDPSRLSELRRHKLFEENFQATALVINAQGLIQTLSDPNSDPSTLERLPWAIRPRIPHQVIVVSGGIVSGSSVDQQTNDTTIFDIMAECWRPIPQLNLLENLSYFGMAVIGKVLYVIGGVDEDGNVLTQCRCLDLQTLEWHNVPHMNTPRCFLETAVIDDRLYAIGGRCSTREIRPIMEFDDSVRLVSAEMYDPNVGCWTDIADMSNRRSAPGAVVVDGKIYVMGGFTGQQTLRSVECYNPVTNAWTELPPLIQPRRSLRCCVHRGQIFAIGGIEGVTRLNSVERFDIKSKTWTLLEPMSVARNNFGLAQVEHRLFVFGGHNDEAGIIKECEVYDTLFDKWYAIRTPDIPRCAFACCVIDDIDFSMRILNYPPRDDPELLRDMKNDRPRYPGPVPPELPESFRIMEPLPLLMGNVPEQWLEQYRADQENVSAATTENTEDEEANNPPIMLPWQVTPFGFWPEDSPEPEPNE